MYELRFDWSKAEVVVEGREGAEFLLLKVSLGSDPDQFWRNAFASISEQDTDIARQMDR